MRVLVTGATGFVGRWLTQSLVQAGHEVIAVGRETDVSDADAITRAIAEVGPDAIAHLAAVAFAPDAAEDPGTAFGITVGGTVNVMEACRSTEPSPVVLVTGSSEVYGAPRVDDLPLRESAPLHPRTPYALSKVAQEAVALAYAFRHGLRVVVARSFNHTGPGQRPVFVVPALAQRVMAVSRGEAPDIPVGNLDVRRDLTDVRDVAEAYRSLLELGADGTIPRGGLVVNVCSGRATAVRFVLEELCRLAGVEATIRVDPALVRPNDPPEIRGDASAIERLAGWRARTPLATTLADVWEAVTSERAPVATPARD